MSCNIPLRVRNIIKKAGSADPYDIADYLGIKIRTVDTPAHVNGFWQQILNYKFIFVNQNLCGWQQKAVIGHELGHIILHPQYRYFCMDRRTYFCSQRHENEADYFSIELCSYSMDIEENFIDLFLKEGWK